VFGWRDGKVGGWKTFLFDWKEKGEDGKLFCLVGKKKGRMENVDYIN